jgi:hypothetical protein
MRSIWSTEAKLLVVVDESWRTRVEEALGHASADVEVRFVPDLAAARGIAHVDGLEHRPVA